MPNHEPNQSKAYHKDLGIAVLILLLLGVPWIYLRNRLSELQYNRVMQEAINWEAFIDETARQNELIISWSILLLTGTIALIVTTRVHKVPQLQAIYLVLPLSLSFIGGSIYTGIRFQRRLTYLVWRGAVDQDFRSLNDLLALQADLFEWSLIPLAVFAVYFLFQVVRRGIAVFWSS